MTADTPFLQATRTAYDTVAADYAALLRNELDGKPFDRAMLAAFVDLVRGSGAEGPVGDLGCGPGRVTAHLASLGVDAFGVDLSPGMVAVARKEHPGLRFEMGSIMALDLGDGTLGGVVAWYSVIHTPPKQLPVVFAEFHRVLAAGGYALLAFQAGDGIRHLEQGYGHTISLDAYRLRPDLAAELLADAGFEPVARLVREPVGYEPTPQAYLVVRKAPLPS
ncbi:methyltransferase family protein [Streptomyces sp. 846.5]|nr:class I SAM-dependent methyltransferase [Streptomyces sp. 846.5]TDU03163.1 methyltransferase family protein [Streptomyces sp. 846.5]